MDRLFRPEHVSEIAHVEGLAICLADIEVLGFVHPVAASPAELNAIFERARILELAAGLSDLAEPLRALADRVVDLLPVARANWYHRDQRGSWSIKAVLPTIAAEFAYADLRVQTGTAAQSAYLEATAPDTTHERRAVIRAALRAYCRRDTEAMIVLARWLCSSPHRLFEL